MKVRILLAAVAVSFTTAYATTPKTWIGGTSGTGEANLISNSLDFAASGNWDPAGMPNGADVAVDMSSAVNTFVTNANPVTVESIKGTGSTWYWSEETLTHTGHEKKTMKMVICGPFEVAAQTAFVGGIDLRGPISCPAGSSFIIHDGGNVAIHDDYWSDVSGGTRTFSKIDKILQYRNDLMFYGPKSRNSADIKTLNGWDFYLTEGSRFAMTKSGFAVLTTWVVGAPLTSTTDSVIKPGTFVKRIYNSLWMELSEPATATGLFRLNFGSVEVHARREIGTFGHNNSVDHNFNFFVNKHRDEDEYVVEVDKFNIFPLALDGGTWKRHTTIGTSSSYKPGLFVIHEQNTVKNGSVRLSAAFRLGTCDILFSSSPNEAGPGLPYALVDQPTATAESRLSVTGDMQAVIQQLYDLKGKITKAGSGTLLAGMTNSAGNTGSIIVKEGTFGVNDAAGADIAEIGTLSIAAGATFRVPAQGFRANFAFSIEPGAALTGAGRLYVPGRVDLTGIAISPGVEVVIGGGESDISMELPAPGVPGNPAFWVDFSNTNKLTLVDLDGGAKGVARADDIRKTGDGDGYMFATNASKDAYCPALKYNSEKDLHYVYFNGNGQGVTSNGYYSASYQQPPTVALTEELVWSRPVAGMREVFQVYGCNSGAAPFLGATSGGRLTAAGGRENITLFGRYSSTQPYFSWAGSVLEITKGLFRVNGRDAIPTSGKFPYTTSITTDGFVPVVAALSLAETASGVKPPAADAFFFNLTYGNQGIVATVKKPVGEIIVYTNVLTEVERLQVTRYLMRKWLRSDVSESAAKYSDTLGKVSGGIVNIPEGSAAVVTEILPSAVIAKTGGGTLQVAGEAYVPAAALAVSGGTLRIVSRDMTIPPQFTTNDAVFARYDASSLDNFDYSYDAVRGVNTVTRWKDVKGSGTAHDATLFRSESTNLPFIAENALNGRSVLDFGRVYAHPKDSDASKKNSSSMGIDQTKGHHTVFAVWGSSNGGGTLLGTLNTVMNKGYGITRAGEYCGSLATDFIIRTDATYMGIDQLLSYVFNLNGVACNPTTTGLSGTYDLVSMSSLYGFGLDGLMSSRNSGSYDLTGGGQFAEMIICDNALPSNRVYEIEAYLRKKWFNEDTPGFRPATLGALTVAGGGTLVVEGGAPVTVSSLTLGGGTVQGSVILAANASLDVAVAADGSTTPVAFTGSFDMSRGGTVHFTGMPAALRVGRHVLVAGANIQSLAGWSVDTSTLRPGWSANLKLEDGDLCLYYVNGTVIIFR
ncbi:MAG: hypothetical protein IKO72_16340 [Kiritimatiellae bacterium]|nr:hypothetical protein [Kiritimatiellia bacterium]